MGGVDKNDQLVSYCRTPARGKKWYFPIVGYCLDLAVVNSYLLYQRHADQLGQKQLIKSCKEFRMEISKSLRCVEKQRGRPSNTGVKKRNLIKSPTYRPPNDVRYDNESHWPVLVENIGRCKLCADGKTKFMCFKCELHLCLKADRNCFVYFHSRK